MNDRIRPELRSLLGELRGKIRRYVLVEGTALILVVLGLLFWISFGIDHAWFQLSRLELPVWFRAMFDVAVIGAVIILLFSWVLFRLFQSFRAKALALVLERRFPELNDRLVTAVELAEGNADTDNALTQAMLNRTVDDVVDASKKLNVGSVFDKRPLRRAVMLATLLVVSIGGLAAANQSALSTWADSFFGLNDEYWDRVNDLEIKIIAQPGDVVRDFRNKRYKHPRGADVTILIEAKDGSVVPDRVQVKYRLESGRGGGTVVCSKIGDRQFKHSVAGLLENLEFNVYGGDFVTRSVYTIEVVDPPRLDKIELACNYPDYMGITNPESTEENPLRDLVRVRGTQVAIPNETEFLLQAESNKQLTAVTVQFDNSELNFSRTKSGVEARLIVRTEDGKLISENALTHEEVNTWLSDGDKKLSIPFVISTQDSQAAKTRIEGLTTRCGKPFVIPPDTQIRIYMQDIDGILTAEPSRMLINGIPDMPPQIESSLRGIGSSITRRASIPLIGSIVDDFGLENVRFSYQVSDDPEWKDLELEVKVEDNHPDEGFLKEFRLEQSRTITITNENDDDEARSKYARFEVTPLDLSIGQQLILSIVATDRDDLNGPHETRSERYTFKVVSKEELLSVLYQRELNLRRQFEQILEETQGIQQDLIRHSIRVDERKSLIASGASDDETKAKLAMINTSVRASAERSLHGIRKNRHECESIEIAFRDIREELVNNALHTPQTLSRLDDKIVAPLKRINEQDYPVADKAVGLFRQANIDGTGAATPINDAIETLELMIKRMESVLAEMQKLETFQEALEQLKAIIKKQEELRERLKKEQKKKLIEGLGDDLLKASGQ
jgi:hypothetical protein